MKIFSRLNLLDFVCCLVLIASILGFVSARAGWAGVNQVIQGSGKVNIKILFVGVKTLDTNIFKVGDKASLTIRNQPVEPPMVITDVKHCPKQVVFLSQDNKKTLTFPDSANPYAYDFLVTVCDEAERTKDGYVVRGNKIKIGNQVELESFLYRIQGIVVGLEPL